jgi:predicted nucleotidyltransferase
MNDDFKDLLGLFNEYQVEYLVIGGYAVVEYTEPRFTKDLDIWVKASEENAQRVYEALSRFGAPVRQLTATDFSREGYFFQMGREPQRIDVLMSIPGVPFDQAWINQHEVQIDGQTVRFIGLQDLITAKEASGRPQDLLDAARLHEALERLQMAEKNGSDGID